MSKDWSAIVFFFYEVAHARKNPGEIRAETGWVFFGKPE